MMMARTCDCVSTHVSRAPEVCDIIIVTLNPPLMSGEGASDLCHIKRPASCQVNIKAIITDNFTFRFIFDLSDLIL